MSPIEPGRSFVVRGAVTPADAPPQLTLDTAFTEDFTLIPEVTIGTASRAAAAEDVEVAPDAVVELELEGGIRLWVSGDRLHETLELTQARGDVDVLVPQLRFAAPSRGPGRWALRALRVFGVSTPADLVATKLVERIEGKLDLGLHRCTSPDGPLGELIRSESQLDASEPLLVLLHGTGSSTAGSFGGLASANGGAAWQRLAQRYRSNALALEHRTMSVSPIENALEVARALPANARLHLVSHSRGGLVGELLARAHVADAPFATEMLALLRARGRASDADALAELGDLLRAKRPRVERFVRVACPARGTTLASGRLDLYLSLMLNALRLVPVVGTSPVAGMLSALVLAVAKKRTQPEELPGLEAMMPAAPLIAVLNDPQVSHDADLAVIAGDIQGAGIGGRLKVLASDLFYRENHDLVVQSSSMAGGTRRSHGRLLFVKGADVSHFQYFRNSLTADRVVSALESTTAAGFEPITDATSSELRTRAPIDVASDRPLVVLLPGIMGSHLTAAGDRVWLDPFDIARGEFRRLALGARDVEAQALMGKAYEKISAYLAASHEVAEFPYDWRRSVTEAGDRLAQLIEGVLDANPRRTVRLLAHSMGGLVARAMIARHPDLWQRITARAGGRLVMLGTPNGGSWSIPRVLLEQESLVRKLALLDLRHSQQELLRYIAEFTGMLELLPHNHPLDFFASERWDGVRRYCGDRFALPSAERLNEAGALPRALQHAIDPQHMVYVCGKAPATPIDYEFTGKVGSMRVRFLATAEGDGRVPWSTGVLPGVPTWYMDVVHGDMAAHPPTFAAIRELLEHGSTMLLPTQPPVARGTTEPFELLPEEPLEYPSETDLQADALGGAAVVPVAPTEPELPLTLAVVHGNLAYSPHPVAVGHYQDDVIVAAEGVLDRQFGGALSELRALGRYPGPRGSARVLLRPDATPPGAIVVGLGAVGELTGAILEESFRHAVLEYVNRVAEDVGVSSGGVPRSVAITSLLIGSGGSGISTTEAVQAIVAGTLAARRALHGTSVAARVSIDRLEFCELYQDVAIAALRALYTVAEDPRVAPRIAVQEELIERPGARRRATFDQNLEWWERLLIAETDDGHLNFQNLTDRARAEARLQGVNRHTLDLFVRDAMRGVEDDPATARTLFALLLPRAVREQAPCRNRMVLVVNEGAARYPWELLRDSPSADSEPLAVQRPLIRQLTTSTFDERPQTSANESALVIGDPPTGWAARLPGARNEARLVAGSLRDASFRTTHLDEPPARAVLGTLLAEPYRVLHIAAHGAYQHTLADGRTVTGVLLSDGAVIGPAEIAAMHPVPELVFLNCCHTGYISDTRARPGSAPYGAGASSPAAYAASALPPGEAPPAADFPRLAANVATQLIRAGVRAVVAAGWAVQDDAALTFARTFYDRMLAGRAFGEAVHAARRETYFQHPAYNTWGAYQCYGDPDYTLMRQRDYAPAAPRRFTCAAELVIEFENLVQDTTFAEQFGPEQLRVRLDALRAQVPEPWRTRPELVAAQERAELALTRVTAPAAATPAGPALAAAARRPEPAPRATPAPPPSAPSSSATPAPPPPAPIQAIVVQPQPEPTEASPTPPRRRRRKQAP